MIQFSINMTIKATLCNKQVTKAQRHTSTTYTTEQDKSQQKTETLSKINMTL